MQSHRTSGSASLGSAGLGITTSVITLANKRCLATSNPSEAMLLQDTAAELRGSSSTHADLITLPSVGQATLKTHCWPGFLSAQTT